MAMAMGCLLYIIFSKDGFNQVSIDQRFMRSCMPAAIRKVAESSQWSSRFIAEPSDIHMDKLRNKSKRSSGVMVFDLE